MAGKSKKEAGNRTTPRRIAANPKLLSGGNPQIAKADGNSPVLALIAAMPGWQQVVGRRLDALVKRTVPDVRIPRGRC